MKAESVCSGDRGRRGRRGSFVVESGAAITLSGRSPFPRQRRSRSAGSDWTSSMTSGVRVASTHPAIPCACGESRPEERVLALSDDGFEHELFGLLVGSRIDDAFAPKIERRPRRSRPGAPGTTLRADDACGHCGPEIGLVGHGHLLRWSRSGRGRSSAGRESARDAWTGSTRRSTSGAVSRSCCPRR